MMAEVEQNSNVDSYDKIAHKLIKEGFLLTALEFHAELIESGTELPRLRDFFSNPGNFEKQSEEDSTPALSPFDASNYVLPRTSSEQTFDSLDFTRNSDDGERQMDERIAVLEFELRKARETIKSLRASLTVSSAQQSEPTQSVVTNTPNVSVMSDMTRSSPQTDSLEDMSGAKPYEIRALNYLVNEYLMKRNYKLTSITFCDENEEQDFESWDDVGLNVPKPPDLLKLFRNYWSLCSRNSSELREEVPINAFKT